MECERCGIKIETLKLHDYCAICSKNLCKRCMKAGCCGNTPAISGSADDMATKYEDE